MDARTSQPDTTPDPDELKVATEQKLSAFGRARRRREGTRKIVRGAIGIVAVLVLWHIMAGGYAPPQHLPPPPPVAPPARHTQPPHPRQPRLHRPADLLHPLVGLRPPH